MSGETLTLLALDREPNPMRATHGPGPDGVRCKTCAYLSVHGRSRNYYKCELRGVTSGSATDHRINWAACSLYDAARGEAGKDKGE